MSKVQCKLTPESAVKLLQNFAEGEWPVSFAFTAGKGGASLILIQDGIERNVEIILQPNGLWSLTTDVEV
jgi:hypothetical protein